jgi:hypothetical protein
MHYCIDSVNEFFGTGLGGRFKREVSFLSNQDRRQTERLDEVGNVPSDSDARTDDLAIHRRVSRLPRALDPEAQAYHRNVSIEQVPMTLPEFDELLSCRAINREDDDPKLSLASSLAERTSRTATPTRPLQVRVPMRDPMSRLRDTQEFLPPIRDRQPFRTDARNRCVAHG